MLARTARVAALAAAVLVAAGCTKTLDTSNLETTLATQLESQLGVSGLTVSCPNNVKVQADAAFQCTATGPAASFTVTVTQKDDRGNVTWKVSDVSTSATPTPSSSP